ncbi:HAD family hydrolase [bacterium]|nr:HAD family hydrolase [bacterium]
MRRVEAIVFDKDGTLFDFQSTWAPVFVKLLDMLALDTSHEETAKALHFDLANMRFQPDSVFVAGTSGEVAETLAQVTGRDKIALEQVLRHVGKGAQQMPAVPLAPCLGALAQNFTLGLVTNDDEASARAHLAQEGVLELFDFVAGYDSGFGGKPAPGQLLAFSRSTGVAADVTLMVGDSRHDLAAGRAAGMGTVGVLTGVAGKAELSDLADVILQDIGQLHSWITGQAGDL